MRRATTWMVAWGLVLACGGCSSSETGPAGDAGLSADADGAMAGDGGLRGDASGTPDASDREDAATDAGADVGVGGFVCPQDGVRGAGVHRLFVQGAEAPALPDGTWPLLHEWRPDGSDAELCDDSIYINDTNGDGVWQPGEEPKPLGPSSIVHGEHFLVGAGAFVEFTATLCDDITGRVAFYIPNFDQEGSVALHQLFVVHDGVETLIAEATDDEPGFSGYSPFVRVLEGVDPDAQPGDTLLLRSTNISGEPFSVMVWRPPSDYESWILVEVP